MKYIQIIKQLDGTLVDAEPLVGAWYCAVTESDGVVNFGALGEYTGFGEFDDEGSDVTDAMHECDYLQLQR